MTPTSLRLISAAGAASLLLAFGGQAVAQTTTGGPAVQKEALNPANQAADKSNPKTAEQRDEKAAATGKRVAQASTPGDTGPAGSAVNQLPKPQGGATN